MVRQNIKNEDVVNKISIYSVLLASVEGSYLYIGLHATLEDALADAKKEFIAHFKKADTHITLDMWTKMDGSRVLNVLRLFPFSLDEQQNIDEQIKMFRENKNKLMKNIIEQKNVNVLRKTRGLLNKEEKKFIINKIKSTI